ncbi:MAG: hypothetical protein OXD41_00980 [Thaumarchaeota archaeon]|nr:hypothetical protein [Nitrososphaerota archaeon]RNJ71672.1 MAG: hypothetical protein EB833_06585 [Thaumarchaeota archaeon S13]
MGLRLRGNRPAGMSGMFEPPWVILFAIGVIAAFVLAVFAVYMSVWLLWRAADWLWHNPARPWRAAWRLSRRLWGGEGCLRHGARRRRLARQPI